MDQLQQHSGNKSSPKSFVNRLRLRLQGWLANPTIKRRWAFRHFEEIVWAFVFAVLVGYLIELYAAEAKPYKIFIVADGDTNDETLKILQAEDQKSEFARIGRVRVQVQLKILDSDTQAAARMAADLASASDTLLVIQHGRSRNIEQSVRAYFTARPQVPLITTVATDDDLLAPCRDSKSDNQTASQADSGSSCFDGHWVNLLANSTEMPFVPLLQLSPTNEVQASSAVQFATERGKRKFLIVLGDDPNDASYTDNMEKDYSDAIRAAHAELIGVRHVKELSDLESLKGLDCILYAGSFGEADMLFTRLVDANVMRPQLAMMLSDSVVQSRGTDTDLARFISVPESDRLSRPSNSGQPSSIVLARTSEHLPAANSGTGSRGKDFPLVNFTYQTDASDYNSHTDPYAADAFSIAQQLINDLNERGGSIYSRFKSLLHVQGAKDVRRDLLRIMRENSSSRTWYKGGSSSGVPYVFEGTKQYHGMFHVWQLNERSALPGKQMEDVDHWHMQKTAPALSEKPSPSNN